MDTAEFAHLVRQGFRQGLINVLLPRPWIRDALQAQTAMELTQKLAVVCDDKGWTFTSSSSLITFSKGQRNSAQLDNAYPLTAPFAAKAS
jgi:hypothetical protein